MVLKSIIKKTIFEDFFESEKSGGIILVCSVFISLLLSNINFTSGYSHIWHYEIFNKSLTHWINDGLMAIFFLMIGLELKREIIVGELSEIKNASLPIFAAFGGMLVPATIFYIFNFNSSSTHMGIGIPMATDIAFAIGILSLLGNKVPTSLKIFLTALAVIDDLGAIIIIAIFYTKQLYLTNLAISLAIFVFLLVLNKLKIKHLFIYLIGGVFMWYYMLNSGVHATIAGVLLAFTIPFLNDNENAPSAVLQKALHNPVAFIILPLFALANTCIVINNNWYESIITNNSVGIISGLFIGKPLGITLFTILSVYLGISSLPKELNWRHIIGAGFLGGIGFTMSIFITLLAYSDISLHNESIIAILLASFLSGFIGFFTLKLLTNK